MTSKQRGSVQRAFKSIEITKRTAKGKRVAAAVNDPCPTGLQGKREANPNDV